MTRPLPGTVAVYDPTDFSGPSEYRPVVAFNDDGEPMVVGHRGVLVPAHQFTIRGMKFGGLAGGCADPVVELIQLSDPVAIEGPWGPDLAYDFAIRASGTVSPVVRYDGVPEVMSEMETWRPLQPQREEGAA